MYDLRLHEVMERRKLVRAASTTTVRAVSRQMAAKGVGAVMVIDDGQLVGIFTERDAVFRVLAAGLDPEATRLADVMTPAPQTLGPDARFGTALALMHKNGFRHVPVVEHGKLVGVVMARQALDPDMEDFVAEERRREHFADV
jgi:CBS domain-containing protein